MKIGIIGTGRIGSTLAQKLAAAGYRVDIAHGHGLAGLAELEHDLGPGVHGVTTLDAMRANDVIVLAVPFGAIDELPTTGTEAKTVIDASNYYPERDGPRWELDSGELTSSELTQRHFPYSHVIKTFNTMVWSHLRDYGHVDGGMHRYGMPASGDDAHAKRMAFDLIESMGFEPVDTGSLADGGRKQEPGGAAYTADLEDDVMHRLIGVDL